MAEIRITDLSKYQGVVNWDQLKSSVQGAVIKATGADDGLYADNMFVRNRDEARRVGLPRWFYHYKGAGSARSQAEYMLKAIGPLQPGEAIVIDDENEPRLNVNFVAEFADIMKSLTGRVPVVYSNLSRFQGTDLAPLRARNMGAWVAKYGSNTGAIEGSGAPPSGIDIPVIMWQYTDKARLPGITVNTVDMNVFYGDVNQFKAYGAQGDDMKITVELANILADTLRYKPGQGADPGFKASFVGKELKDVLVAFQNSEEFKNRRAILSGEGPKKLEEVKRLTGELSKVVG